MSDLLIFGAAIAVVAVLVWEYVITPRMKKKDSTPTSGTITNATPPTTFTSGGQVPTDDINKGPIRKD